MKIFLADQNSHLQTHLEHFKTVPLSPYNRSDLTEKTTAIAIDTTFGLHQLNTEFFFAYNIFPLNAMRHLTEWEHERRSMRVGDTIVQLVYLPPIGKFSVKIIVGVRIQDIINEPTRIGFGYDTIEGHIEKGRATFTLEEDGEHKIRFKIHTFSKPSNVLARMVGPVISVPYQKFITGLALKNVKQQLELQTAAESKERRGES